MAKLLTKSNYKLARDCPTKLYYKKKKYPSIKDKDGYLKLLADGGYMVEWIAKLIHGDPDQDEVSFGRSSKKAFEESLVRMQKEQVTLFEPTLISQGKSARVDILKRDGNRFDLIEVKAKSWDSKNNEKGKAEGYPSLFQNRNGKVNAKWREYLEDVTFQVLVLEEVLKEYFPEIQSPAIHAFLCMPDKAKTTQIDELQGKFILCREEVEEGKIQEIEVLFDGDREALRNDNFMTTVPVDVAVEELSNEVKFAAEEFVSLLQPELKPAKPCLGAYCANCEYRGATDDPNTDGFRQCWGKMAEVKPHILELYELGNTGPVKDRLAARLAEEGRACLTDIRENELVKVDGSVGVNNEKQLIQINCTRLGDPWFTKKLGATIRDWEWPLRFIDFEASTIAVPYHAGMRPYEQVAFQWSVHTLDESGKLDHEPWLNTSDRFPAFEFAETLKDHLRGAGTYLMWSPFEDTTLKNIKRQMKKRNYENSDLSNWLKSAGKRFVDMKELVWNDYYHPLMKGSGSIKNVVDAAWFTEPELQEEFPEYVKHSETGKLLSPYEALSGEIINGAEECIVNGTDAVNAYQRMMYGVDADQTKEARAAWKRLLLKYCKLDTAAMVMVWRHWKKLTEETHGE